ncbi:CPBP family intramembrane glutamic endopeptidase [Aldersonia kunmingensis]|uniref:CPBP family intramembrane glutamic endopeptidase n=1 Tax=Aldersonia kunmingensis TaxID=408066 RepID=UPI003CCC3A59
MGGAPIRPRRPLVFVAAVVVVLIATNLIAHFTGSVAADFAVPVMSVLLVFGALMAGLTWADLGLTPAQLKAGIPYAVAAVVIIAAIVAIAVAIPATREFFLSSRYDSTSEAAFAALVIIPLQTVLPEELAFRGVLQGALMRCYAPRVALLIGAGLFGLWHISSSLGLTEGNAGLSDSLGSGTAGQIAGILGAVAATTFAGLVLGWLRLRSDSLLAPIALHWALNATGAIGAAVAWQLSGG